MKKIKWTDSCDGKVLDAKFPNGYFTVFEEVNKRDWWIYNPLNQGEVGPYKSAANAKRAAERIMRRESK